MPENASFEVDALTDNEIEEFQRNGFVGPFSSGLDEAFAISLGDRCEAITRDRAQHPLYRRYAQRDWHLVDQDLENLFSCDAIVGRVRQLLGEDLLLWRTKIFVKGPGAGAIGWHQEWGAFDGEEIGNSSPSLVPVEADRGIWDLTVWIALDQITLDNGPLEFAVGSQETRWTWKSVPMTKSAFYEDPFGDLDSAEIERRTRADELLLDIDTAGWLNDFPTASATREQLIAHLEAKFDNLNAKFTHFEPEPGQIVTPTMNPGDFVIFSERTMHGSPANHSTDRRVAINGRYTRSDTLIYPGRLMGNVVDGSNLDISDHESLLVSGSALEGRNKWRSPRGKN